MPTSTRTRRPRAEAEPEEFAEPEPEEETPAEPEPQEFEPIEEPPASPSSPFAGDGEPATGEPVTSPEGSPPEVPEPEEETEPQGPPTSPVSRAKAWWRKSTKATKTEPNKKRTRAAKRVSWEEPAGWVWGFVGSTLVKSDVSPAAGRVMGFQGPVVGPMVDDLAAGTFADRILQPILQKGEQFKALGSVMGLPIAVMIAERNPATLKVGVSQDGRYVVDGFMAPVIYGLIAENIELMGPVIARQKKDTERRQKIMAEVFPELVEQDIDPVLYVMAQIFPIGEPAPVPAADAA